MINSLLFTFIGTYTIVYFVLLLSKNTLLLSISTGLLTGILIYISANHVKLNKGFLPIFFNPILAMCHYLEGLITFVQLVLIVSTEIIAGLFAFLTKKYIL